MRRRDFFGVVGGAVAWPLAARAQPNNRMRRIGVLIAGPSGRDAESQLRMAAFRGGLETLGWIDGRNMHLDVRYDSAERLRSSATELVQMRPDVIFAGNGAAMVALRGATNTLPTVFAQVTDPVGSKFVESIARPGGNSTGFAMYEYGVAAKWVEILREIAPRTACIGVIYDELNNAERHLPGLKDALPPDVMLLPISVHSRSEIDPAIDQIASQSNPALIVLPGPLAAGNYELIVSSAIKRRLPSFYPYDYFASAGGLVSYGPDIVDQYRLRQATSTAFSGAKGGRTAGPVFDHVCTFDQH
jgi:putative ABC transport system substrate-binding protein